MSAGGVVQASRAGAAAAALLALAACATTPASQTPAAPSGAIDLGDFRRASAESTARAFAREIGARYREGVPLNAVSADLARNHFTCRTGESGRGDPPDRVCRRSLRVEGCVHTWQVLLYGEARLARLRSTYDRACGDDDLLGG